jgi:hypothetical protein
VSFFFALCYIPSSYNNTKINKYLLNELIHMCVGIGLGNIWSLQEAGSYETSFVDDSSVTGGPFTL